MTPEEHFEKASEHLVEANSTNNTARFWAQMRVSEHHTALGRAKSEHEARKDFAAERARATIPPYTPIPAARARDLMAQMQPGGGAAELAGQVDDLSAACAQKDQEIEHLTDQVRTLKADGDAYETICKKWDQRGAEIERLAYQLRQKETHLTDLSNAYKVTAKQWTERGDRILTLEQEIKALKDKLAKFTSPDQPTPLTDGLPAVPEKHYRMVIDCPADVVYECADFSPIRMRLVDAEGDPVKVHIRRTFGRTEDVQAKLSETKFKPRIIYGALRPAEQVWRTPKATKWGGLRGRWAVDADVVSDVAEVFVRSVDYPDTDEVGVDLVTWPKDLEPSRRSHDTLEILNRQRMSRKAWATHPDNIGDMEHP